jgi:hypothetical protein
VLVREQDRRENGDFFKLFIISKDREACGFSCRRDIVNENQHRYGAETDHVAEQLRPDCQNQ